MQSSKNEVKVRRALVSVSDKRGVVEFARTLESFGVEILSTGGTARLLTEAGIAVVLVEDFTGFPEMLDGRVKTLHPRVHAGILYRRDDARHVETMARHELESIDLVAVNLYPFESTVAQPDVSWEEAIEQVDIGGPTLLRSAAKNHASVVVVCDPNQYEAVADELRRLQGATSLALRQRLAAAVFVRTSGYDRAISEYFHAKVGNAAVSDPLPERLRLDLGRELVLRYGENPHQAAAVYGDVLRHLQQHHGKELSYNNLLDLCAAYELAFRLGALAEGDGAAVAIIKHSNPCGAAHASSVRSAWELALATDPQSASGGIVATQRVVDEDAATALSGHFIEVLVAPGYTAPALEILKRKKNRVLLTVDHEFAALLTSGLQLKTLPGGILVQTADALQPASEELRVVTQRRPTDGEIRALRFAWQVVRSVKSNAVVFTSDVATLGVGAGQMSRVDAARFAVTKAAAAGCSLSGSVVASDAFFPFADGLLVAADAGATAVIQPGGSVRDAEVIAAADERGVAMVLTGTRHFRH